MNRTDLMMARMKIGLDNDDLARRLCIKKRQIDAWERYDHVPDDWVPKIQEVCGIVVKRQKTHPAVRTSSGVRFGWEER